MQLLLCTLQVSRNIVEESHSKNKVLRSMPIVEQHMTFLKNTAVMFTARHTKALSYFSIRHLIVKVAADMKAKKC